MALTDKLSAIGNAIRAKTGKEEKFALDQMPTEIAGIFGDGTLGPIRVTENGTYYPTYEIPSVTWDENTEYDNVINVDGVSLRYKKAASLIVPDSVYELERADYCLSLTLPDGTVQSVPLSNLDLYEENGAYCLGDMGYTVVWIKDAAIVNYAFNASLEDNTVYITDYPWLAHPDEYTGASFTLTAPGKKLDGFSSVTVAVESTGGGGSMAVNGIVKQYKVSAGATVNAGDFVEFVTNFGGGTFADAEAVCMAACKLDNDRVFVVYAASSKIYAVVLTVTNQTITIGERTAIASYSSSYGYVAAASVGGSRVIVSYGGIACLFSVDGSNITVAGNSLAFCGGDTFYFGNVASIHDNMAAIACAYKSGSYFYPRVFLIDVTNNELSSFSNMSYSSSSKSVDAYVVKLSTNKIGFLHSNPDGVDLSLLAIEDTGLREITRKNIYNYPYVSTYEQTGIRAVALSENLLIVSYRPRSTGTYNDWTYHNYCAVTIDESGIKSGGARSLENGGIYATGLGKLSDSSALLVYRSSEKETAGVLKIDVTGNTVEQTKYDLGTPLGKIEKGISTLIPFSDDRMLLISSAGIAAIYRTLTVDDTGVTVHVGTADVDAYVQPATSRSHNVGIAATGGSEGDMIDVHVAGILRSETTYENYFTSSVKETTSGTELTSSVNCGVGDLVVAAIATRDTLTLSDGWNLISTSEVNSTDTTNQRLSWAYKYAESTTESITVTQASEQRLYINMVALPGATGVTDNGYTYNDDSIASSITASKPEGLVLWGMTAPSWTNTIPCKGWETTGDMQIVQLASASTQPRLGVGLDQSSAESVTFKSYGSSQSIIGCLTVQGIDKFYTAATHTWLE